jgi:hypothetical protein
MIRQKTQKSGPIVIDITGPEGNAFVLMGYAKNYAKQLNMDYKPIIEDMTSGDYEHLLEVFDKHFGEFIILER